MPREKKADKLARALEEALYDNRAFGLRHSSYLLFGQLGRRRSNGL